VDQLNGAIRQIQLPFATPASATVEHDHRHSDGRVRVPPYRRVRRRQFRLSRRHAVSGDRGTSANGSEVEARGARARDDFRSVAAVEQLDLEQVGGRQDGATDAAHVDEVAAARDVGPTEQSAFFLVSIGVDVRPRLSVGRLYPRYSTVPGPLNSSRTYFALSRIALLLASVVPLASDVSVNVFR